MADTQNTKIVLSIDQQKSAAQINADIKKLQNNLKKVMASGALDTETTVKKINSQIKALESQLKTITLDTKTPKIETTEHIKFLKKARTENEEYIKSLHKTDSQLNRMDTDTLKKSVDKTNESLKETGKLGESVKKFFSGVYKTFASGIVVSQLKEIVSELMKTDTLLTQISMSDKNLSGSKLEDIADNAAKTAGKYGVTSNEYLSQVHQASLSGYENPEEIAELSVAMQAVGGITSELANSYINAADNAYELGGSTAKLKENLDGIYNISKNSSVNIAQLTEGMSSASSTAASLGISADKAAAALAVIMSSSHMEAPETAQAFNSILLGLGQIEDSQAGISAEGIAKFEEACSSLNVSLTNTRNGVTSLKDPMQLLKELSVEYSKLNDGDVRRENFLNFIDNEAAAEAMDALLDNYDTYEKMIDYYASGTGTLTEAAQLSADGWKGSLNRLSNTFTDTIGNIADSDAITSIINALNSLLSVIDNITGKLGSFKSIAMLSGLLMNKKGIGECTVSSGEMYCAHPSKTA